MSESISLVLRTKLHVPNIPNDLVPRPRLYKRLNRSLDRSLAIINAPAGYGKSVLVSSWLETVNTIHAWISLDEDHSDLIQFLTFFLAAIQKEFPNFGNETTMLLNAPERPPHKVFSDNLLKDLEEINAPVVLVLDDYHRLDPESEVHALMSEFLDRAPKDFHLVVLSRLDLPFYISNLRAQGKMVEMRLMDLRFTSDETIELLERMIGHAPNQSEAVELTNRTEGWVTALRLAALSMRHAEDIDSVLVSLQGDNRYVKEYLVGEVLSHQLPEVQTYLLKTSNLDRFCAPLCEAVCGGDKDLELSGEEFIRYIQDADLFVIPLDTQGAWYRYHHLFQELLQLLLKDLLGHEEIAEINSRSSAWFAENDLIDEALKFALAASDISYAVRLIEKHRHQLMNTEQWTRLESWLDKLPPSTLEKNPKLLVTRVWTELLFHSQYKKWRNAPDQIEALLSGFSTESDEKTMIIAEINAIRATLLYTAGEVDRSIDSAEHVLGTLHPEANSMRGQTAAVLAMALQGTGNLDGALETIYNTLDNCSSSDFITNTKMLMGLCAIHWLEGNIPETKRLALKLLKLGEVSNLPESISFGRYFLGCSHYVLNELAESESNFRAVVENRHLARQHYYAQCAFGLALCEIAQDCSDQARQVVESVIEYTMETNNTWLRDIARGFRAEITLRLNQSVKTFDWMKVADLNFLAPMYVFYVPKLTAVRAMLAIHSPESLKDASDLLDNLQEIVVSTHNTRVRIDVLALQAILCEARGDEKAALHSLHESLALAEPGGFIRNYIDMGPKMVEMLTQLQAEGRMKDYIGRILNAVEEDRKVTRSSKRAVTSPGDPSRSSSLVEPLTHRELETLRLLALDLTTEEVADKMVVSIATVRSHTNRIYAKLDAHSRYEAVQRAKDLDLLSLTP